MVPTPINPPGTAYLSWFCSAKSETMRLEMGAPITMARDAQADAAIGHLDGFVAALEKLEEIKADLGASTRSDLRSFADVIDFDERKIQ